MMGKFGSRAGAFGLIAGVALAGAACGQVGLLKAKMAFKDANVLYQQQDYRAAAAKYEETLNECRGSEPDCGDPKLAAAYFFLANSYDNQFRPTKRGDPANDQLLTKAIDNYKKSAQVESDPKIRKLAMEYLVAAYGPDKLNDPSQAEPVVRRMIELEPNEPTNYFYLARIYEDSGDYEQAEQLLQKAREVKPSDPQVYMSQANFYKRQGEFDKTMEALLARAQQEPNNPEAHYSIAVEYWDKGYRDVTLPVPQRIKLVQSGLGSVDKAIELKPDYTEALTYKGLLLRAQANLEKDPAKQQQLLREADQVRDRAVQIRDKQKASGAGE